MQERLQEKEQQEQHDQKLAMIWGETRQQQDSNQQRLSSEMMQSNAADTRVAKPKAAQHRPSPKPQAPAAPKEIVLPDDVTARQLAALLREPSPPLIC